MADTEYKRLVDTAKERAFFGFLALAQRALQDTDKNVVQLLGSAKSGFEQSALQGVRHFIRQDGNRFVRKVDVLFRTYLERALQTMYVDMRAGMRQLTADELSLIDDEAVNHQIEVGRLTQRMRESNEEVIGRLNVIIAHLNGEREAKERENPFRPYILARCVYEAVRELASDEAQSRILFNHLANGMIQHLPGYYTAIRDLFEESGFRGKFIAKPSRSNFYQRYFGAPPKPSSDAPAHFNSQVLPGLQRMMQALQNADSGQAGSADNDVPASVQEFLRRMVTPSRASAMADGVAASGRKASSLHPVAAQLTQFQKMAASGEAAADGDGVSNQPFDVRDRLKLDSASPVERMTIEVVAMLFTFILEDEQIPAELRQRISRLQIPILKAAILDPDLMQQEDHPARQLLNRMSSASVNVDTESQGGVSLIQEVDRIVDIVLAEFDDDIGIFSRLLDEFEDFLVESATRDDDTTRRGVEAVETAERISVLRTNITNSLCDLLLPLNVDKRISDVIIHIWPHILAHSLWKDGGNGVPPDHAESFYRSCRAILPKLIWSIQPKRDPQERAELIRMLPNLVKQIAKAFEMIRLPQEETKQVMDLLIELHSRILRSHPKDGTETNSLEELQQVFSRMAFSWERVSWSMDDPPTVRDEIMEEVLAWYRLTPVVSFGSSVASASLADREFLSQTYLLGTKVELRPAGGEGRRAQLIWISAHRSLFLFKRETDNELVIYSFASLLDSLRDGSVIPVEYAPVFERAVESLLFSADKAHEGVGF
jgi:hypothetical protein